MVQYVTFVTGLLALIGGGSLFLHGAVVVAQRFGISPLMVGLVLVGFGTSLPELVTSLKAASAGSPGIAVGNVVGSNIANILLILGLAAVIRPLATNPAALRRDGTVMLLAALACLAVGYVGVIDHLTGALLFSILAGYIAFTYWKERRSPDASAQMHKAEATMVPVGATSLPRALGFTLGGLVLIMLGAHWLVSSASEIARGLGIAESVIGLTLIAVGTSLPELVMSVIASVRGQSDIAFGNIVGSNIFNVFGILGVTAMIHPVSMPAEIVAFDNWVMLLATLVLILFALTGRRVSRIEGALFLSGYALYIGYQVA